MITINRAHFLRALRSAARFAPRKSSIAALELVRLRYADKKLTCSATDIEVAGAFSIEASGKGELDILIAPARVMALVDAMDSDVVSIAGADNGVTIHGGSAKYRLACEAGANAPVTPECIGKAGETISLDAADLRLRLLPFAASDALRPAMCAVHVTRDEAAATDGHRLACVKLREGPKIGVTIPVRFLALAIPYATDDVLLVATDAKTGRVVTRGDDYEISARLITDEYPEYRSVVPDHLPKSFVLSRAAISAAVRRALVISDDVTRHVALEFAGAKLRVTASGGAGSGVDDVAIAAEVKAFTIGFNGEYLAEMLDAVSGETITMTADTPSRTTVWRGDGEYFHLIMPVRLANEGNFRTL